MSARTALFVLALLMPGTAAGFEARDKRPQTTEVPAKSDLSEKNRPQVLGPIARYRDGGYISDINGQRAKFLFRPGMIVEINGKGFGERAQKSYVTLIPPPSASGMFLDIACWTDTRVVVVVPSVPSRWIPATNEARMILQGVKPSSIGDILTYYDIGNIRFVADP